MSGARGTQKAPTAFSCPSACGPHYIKLGFFTSLANLTLQHKALLYSCSPVGDPLYYYSSCIQYSIYTLNMVLLVMLVFKFTVFLAASTYETQWSPVGCLSLLFSISFELLHYNDLSKMSESQGNGAPPVADTAELIAFYFC